MRYGKLQNEHPNLVSEAALDEKMIPYSCILQHEKHPFTITRWWLYPINCQNSEVASQKKDVTLGGSFSLKYKQPPPLVNWKNVVHKRTFDQKKALSTHVPKYDDHFHNLEENTLE